MASPLGFPPEFHWWTHTLTWVRKQQTVLVGPWKFHTCRLVVLEIAMQATREVIWLSSSTVLWRALREVRVSTSLKKRCVCVCVYVVFGWPRDRVHVWRSEDHSVGLVLSFPLSTGSKDWTRGHKVCASKCLHLLSRPAGPLSYFYAWIITELWLLMISPIRIYLLFCKRNFICLLFSFWPSHSVTWRSTGALCLPELFF